MLSLDELNPAMSRGCCVEPEQVPRDHDYARAERVLAIAAPVRPYPSCLPPFNGI